VSFPVGGIPSGKDISETSQLNGMFFRLVELPESMNKLICQRLPVSWRRPFEQSFCVSLAHVSVHTGAAVDQLLTSEGALGLAWDRSTILLSRRLSEQPLGIRRLVLGHELAHTIQLGRQGSDDESSLETEAWTAADKALRGIAHCVRGGARTPLRALAFVAMEGARGDAAVTFYQRFKAERMVQAGSIAVQVIAASRVSPVNFDALLDAIIANYPTSIPNDKSLLIAAHGNTKGLTMPLLQGSAFAANSESLSFLGQPNAATTKLQSPSKKTPPPTQAQIASLVAKMQQVQQLGLANLEFRGCALGSDPANLDALQAFFGCTGVSAPDILSNWGTATPNILTTKNFDNWVAKTPGVQVSTYPAGRFGWSIPTTTRKTGFVATAGQLVVAAESQDVIPLWLKDNMISATPIPSNFESWMSSFPWHALTANPLILPMDRQYAAHIKRVVKTPQGLVHM
jgi:hypothetical protein